MPFLTPFVSLHPKWQMTKIVLYYDAQRDRLTGIVCWYGAIHIFRNLFAVVTTENTEDSEPKINGAFYGHTLHTTLTKEAIARCDAVGGQAIRWQLAASHLYLLTRDVRRWWSMRIDVRVCHKWPKAWCFVVTLWHCAPLVINYVGLWFDDDGGGRCEICAVRTIKLRSSF